MHHGTCLLYANIFLYLHFSKVSLLFFFINSIDFRIFTPLGTVLSFTTFYTLYLVILYFFPLLSATLNHHLHGIVTGKTCTSFVFVCARLTHPLSLSWLVMSSFDITRLIFDLQEKLYVWLLSFSTSSLPHTIFLLVDHILELVSV